MRRGKENVCKRLNPSARPLIGANYASMCDQYSTWKGDFGVKLTEAKRPLQFVLTRTVGTCFSCNWGNHRRPMGIYNGGQTGPQVLMCLERMDESLYTAKNVLKH